MAYLSQLNVNNSDYDLKDAEARNDLRSTQTVTGNPLTLTDCAPINAESLVVEFSPKQDLHGQSAPYVGGAGKNKLPMTVDGIKAANTHGTWSGNAFTWNGIVYTILTDGGNNVIGIDIDGTLSGGSASRLVIGKNITLSGNYLITGGKSTNQYIQITNAAEDAQITTNEGGETSLSNFDNYVARIIIKENVSHSIFYPMIRLSAESDSTFAPYTNICPISGYTECEVDDVGKNLFNPETVGVGYINDVDGAVYTTVPSNHSDYIEVKPNTYYCMTTPQTNGLWGAWYDDNKDYISGITLYNQGKKQAPNNAKYLRITVNYNNNNTDYANNVMVEEGENHTTYEPYHSSNATIQFGQIVFGGKSNFTEGGTKKSMDLFDAGEATWNYTNGRFYTQKPCKLYEQSTVAVLLCSQYQTVSYQVQGITDKTISSYAGYIYVRDDSFNGDPTAFTTAMDGVQICYTLATPTSIATTPTDLKLLQGTNNITTNGTTINLGYQPDNVIGDVKGEIEKIKEMPYLRILDNDVDTEVKNYRLYYRLISSSYTLVNLAEMLQHRFLFVEIIQNPSGTANHTLLHSALIDPRTIDGFEYQMKAGTGDTVIIESNIAENKFDLSVRYTSTHTSGDPTDYYVTIRMVD